MYNKLFAKILTSSIWLEDAPTRIVWITLLAAMDETGFAKFSAVGNLAHAARVTPEEATRAVAIFEQPDPESGNPANEGRRVERVPGGWMVLNAEAHRSLITRAAIQEQTRLRVKRHRDKKVVPSVTGNVTGVTDALASVTCNTSEALSDTDTEEQPTKIQNTRAKTALSPLFDSFWLAYPRKVGKGQAEKAWGKIAPDGALVGKIMQAIAWQANQPGWRKDGGKFIPHPTTWLNGRRWEDEPFDLPGRIDPNADVFGRVFGKGAPPL